MKDKKVMLIAGAGAVVLLGILGYTFVGSSSGDAEPSGPYSKELADPSSPDDAAVDSPTRGAVPDLADSSSSRLSAAADSSETEEAEDEAATEKKKRKNRKGRKGYSSNAVSDEEEATANQPQKTIRTKKKIPLGGG